MYVVARQVAVDDGRDGAVVGSLGNDATSALVG